MSDKELYRALSEDEPSLPLFSRAWWLDAAAGPDAWDVVLVRNAGEVVAAMPYVLSRRYGLNVIAQPPLTQTLGPWFRACAANPAKRMSNEKEYMEELIERLPAFDHFNQNWHYSYTNWLPFAWNGFRQTTRYTYILPDIRNTEAVWAGLHTKARGECKKAAGRFGLDIVRDVPLDKFLMLNRMIFERQGMAVPYSQEVVRRIDAACARRGCRMIVAAADKEGRMHAANYVVWDENSAYGLLNGSDPALRTSGALTLCVWEGIRLTSQLTKRFDFTGSMLKPVERFIRSFSATQMPYFNISKTPSRVLRMRQSLRAVLGRE